MNSGDLRLQRRVLLALCALLLIAAVVLGITALRNNAYRGRTETQLGQRMASAAASAVDEVNRMSGVVTSSTSARLARVRQYVYLMEQLNALSMALSGGESGRLAPDAAFVALYSDLDTFEAQTQTSTSSTLDTRTLLLAHLTELQRIVTGQ